MCPFSLQADQLGGLFGVMESVESVAGMVGPTLGGLAAARHPQLPLAAVCGSYGVAFVLVVLFFKKHVSDVAHAKQPAASAEGGRDRAALSTASASAEAKEKVQ
jgi:hypothetical protein